MKLREAVLAVRDCGTTNMFDLPKVAELAETFGYEEEATWLRDRKNQKTYSALLFQGDAGKWPE